MDRAKNILGHRNALRAVICGALLAVAGIAPRVAAAADTPPVQLAYAVPGPANAVGAPSSTTPFTRNTFRAVDIELFPKWHAVLSRMDAQLRGAAPASIAAGKTAHVRDAFHRIVEQVSAQSGVDMLAAANELINAVSYRTDQELYGVSDYWATPIEMLAMGGGDCEDHAIAKLAVLRQAGISAQSLRLVVGIDTATGKPHAMAAVELSGVAYALDGRTNRVVAWNGAELQFKALYAAGFQKAWIYRT